MGYGTYREIRSLIEHKREFRATARHLDGSQKIQVRVKCTPQRRLTPGMSRGSGCV